MKLGTLPVMHPKADSARYLLYIRKLSPKLAFSQEKRRYPYRGRNVILPDQIACQSMGNFFWELKRRHIYRVAAAGYMEGSYLFRTIVHRLVLPRKQPPKQDDYPDCPTGKTLVRGGVYDSETRDIPRW